MTHMSLIQFPRATNLSLNHSKVDKDMKQI
jgi:hypothetical protein